MPLDHTFCTSAHNLTHARIAMDLTEKIGQLFMLGFRGSELTRDNPVVEDLQKHNLGGIILFDRFLARKEKENNIKNPLQLRNLTDSIKAYAATPPLIAVDQEGGMVRRLKGETGFPITKSAKELGDANDPVLTKIHASCTALLLRAVGINLNLSPSVDVDTNPENPVIGKLGRSFSSDADMVIKHASIWIKEHRKQQILTCLKHFPGHGSSQADSHLGFTDISQTWNDKELRPFRELINENLADCVMPGHLFHSDLDPNFPSSLSSATIDVLLRKKLHFSGLVISDDLQMRAITERYGLAESACLAIASGVDMVIIGNNLDLAQISLPKIIQTIITAVESGQIPEQRITQAFTRIKMIKEQIL